MSYVSHKFQFPKELNQLSEKLTEFKRKGSVYIDLTVSNPTLAGLNYPETEIKALLAKNEIFQYAPHPKGLLNARKAIVEYYQNRGKQVSAADFFLTTGTSESISFLLKLFCNPGDEILIPAPGYPLYEFISAFENVVAKKYYLQGKQEGKTYSIYIDFERLNRVITPGVTKILFLVQPNNPIGCNLPKKELDKIIDFVCKHKLILVVDEVFSDYSFQKEHYEINYENIPIITLNGLSKILGLPQMKLSWIHIAGNSIFVLETKEALEFLTDAFLSVSLPVMIATSGLLSLRNIIQDQIKERVLNNLVWLDEIIAANPTEYIAFKVPDAGWYLVIDIKLPIPDENFALRLLKEKSVYVYPGYMFDFEDGCKIIISLLTSKEVFVEGMRRTIEFVNQLGAE